MKQLIVLLFAGMLFSTASNAQTTATEHKIKTEHSKTKAKPTSTIPQKVNNVIRPKHKKYKGYKVKHKVEK